MRKNGYYIKKYRSLNHLRPDCKCHVYLSALLIVDSFKVREYYGVRSVFYNDLIAASDAFRSGVGDITGKGSK
jgi:hypothetical protein